MTEVNTSLGDNSGKVTTSSLLNLNTYLLLGNTFTKTEFIHMALLTKNFDILSAISSSNLGTNIPNVVKNTAVCFSKYINRWRHTLQTNLPIFYEKISNLSVGCRSGVFVLESYFYKKMSL